ncbi:MAG: hypothetical protein H6709_22120 [Kofleriaceae bacterium]|nr:hypothetical protein [Myxococcales bacterium]MCB9562366.1 hypothetical protein [Kofleriaceae bacterium]MCB9574781.1 hypothetical protein [Kofleriaceae bacterium]
MTWRQLLTIVVVLALPALPATSRAETAAAAATAAGTDFGAEARTLYRVGACGGSDAIPARFSTRAIDHHCHRMARRYDSYRAHWVDRARDFIRAIVPTGAPQVVVYPFGGGDLSSALTVFPDATEITTLSLEAAGDVRAIDTIDAGRLRKELDVIAKDVNRLYRAAHSTTKSLQTVSHGQLPGTIVFALAALVVHGQQPVSLRYFTIEADGSLRYLTGAELDAAVAEVAARAEADRAGTKKARRKRAAHYWREQESVFANVEITFVPVDQPTATPRVYRHIVANLDDEHLGADDRVLVHLAAKGKVSTMTKAASFLLWFDDFSKIRTYLLDHMAFMISDASGIAPADATAAGFEQIPYGSFKGPYFTKGDRKHVHRQFEKLWKDSPRRKLPFRFGYPDSTKKGGHLMITQPASCAGRVPC